MNLKRWRIFLFPSFLCLLFLDLLLYVLNAASLLAPVWRLIEAIPDYFSKELDLLFTRFSFVLWIGAAVILIFGIARLLIAQAGRTMQTFPAELETITEPLEVAEPESPSAVAKFSRTGRGFSLVNKIVLLFAAIVAGFGIAAMSIVYNLMLGGFEMQFVERSRAEALKIAVNLSEAMLQKNMNRLQDEVLTYALQPTMAYVVVEDEQGRVLASGMKESPGPLQEGEELNSRRNPLAGSAPYRQGEVSQARVAIGGGKLGTLSIGIWRNDMEDEAQRVFWKIALCSLLLLAAGIILFFLAARRLICPFFQLVVSAEQISRGVFDTPIGIRRNDEIGELARSLDRMRSSLKAAMTRLD
ncbi:MAG: HAMP domain-containing protein [Candidatus Binatia bacterium]